MLPAIERPWQAEDKSLIINLLSVTSRDVVSFFRPLLGKESGTEILKSLRSWGRHRGPWRWLRKRLTMGLPAFVPGAMESFPAGREAESAAATQNRDNISLLHIISTIRILSIHTEMQRTL